MKNKFRALSVKSEIPHFFNSNSYLLRVSLIVIGNVIFTNGSIFLIKMILSRRKLKYNFIAFPAILSDSVQYFPQYGRSIFFYIGFQAKIGNIIYTIGAQISTENKNPNKPTERNTKNVLIAFNITLVLSLTIYSDTNIYFLYITRLNQSLFLSKIKYKCSFFRYFYSLVN